jgi:hypothetical protein
MISKTNAKDFSLRRGFEVLKSLAPNRFFKQSVSASHMFHLAHSGRWMFGTASLLDAKDEFPPANRNRI